MIKIIPKIHANVARLRYINPLIITTINVLTAIEKIISPRLKIRRKVGLIIQQVERTINKIGMDFHVTKSAFSENSIIYIF